MKRAAILLALLIASPAFAQDTNAVERFVAAVQSGADWNAGEFASVINSEEITRLAKVAKCLPGVPRIAENATNAAVMWDCTDVPGVASAVTLFKLDDGKIVNLYTTPATVVRTR